MAGRISTDRTPPVPMPRECESPTPSQIAADHGALIHRYSGADTASADAMKFSESTVISGCNEASGCVARQAAGVQAGYLVFISSTGLPEISRLQHIRLVDSRHRLSTLGTRGTAYGRESRYMVSLDRSRTRACRGVIAGGTASGGFPARDSRSTVTKCVHYLAARRRRDFAGIPVPRG